jgi:hypothetical protein
VKPVKLTAGLVRKRVDEELGVDRVAKAAETKRQCEEMERHWQERRAELKIYLLELRMRLDEAAKELAAVDDDAWKHHRKENPQSVGLFHESLARLAAAVPKGGTP